MAKSDKKLFRCIVLILLAASAALFASCAAADEVTVQYPASAGVGKPFIVRVTSLVPLTGAEAVWQGRTTSLGITVWNDRYIALALLGTHVGNVKPGDHTLLIRLLSNSRRSEHSFKIKITPVQYREDRLTVPESMVTPPASVLDRIAAERKLTREALATMTTERRWGLPMVRPVPGAVTSPYGRRRILNNRPRNPHGGVDYRAAVGTPVKAALPGTVVLTGDHYYAGGSIYVDSGGGVISHYFHMDSIAVKKGDVVKAGQVIGGSGATGRVTGPHLHFGLGLSGQLVDPEPLFSKTVAQMQENSAYRRFSPQWK